MPTATLLLFFLLLLALLAYALKLPSLALPIGIMTFSYKQIAALALPFLQSHDTIFNFIVAGPIVAVFIYHFSSRVKLGCHSSEGRVTMRLLWVFLGYFWFTSLWSPYLGFDSWKFLPYFAVYFWILPLLIDSDPEAVLKAFQLAWILTFLAALSLLLSPAFFLSPNTERMIIHYQAGRFEESNPLVLADLAAYLFQMSLLVLVWPLFSIERRRFSQFIHLILVASGLALGFWLAFNTSRGETVAGIFCGCLFLALVKGRSTLHSIFWLAGVMGTMFVSAALVLLLFSPKGGIEKWSARYSPDAIAEGSDQRHDLTSRNIHFALSSPTTFLFGKGARATEKQVGTWPHNHFAQAFGESGMFGLLLLCACCFLALRFGFRTLALTRESGDRPSLILTAFMLCLLIYQLIVLSKKGSLTFWDTYMWIAIAVYSFDRIQFFLRSTSSDNEPFEAIG